VKLKAKAVTIIFILATALILMNGCAKSVPPPAGELKALIIDQLSLSEPNQAFADQTSQLLTQSGYKVDLYKGDEVNVDFLRGISEKGYRLIVFRAHAGLLGSGGKAIPKTCIFTNEGYSTSKHVSEQLSEKLAKARLNPNTPWVFAVGADFIRNSLSTHFNGTTVIMMGCSTLYIDDLAKSFVDKGALAYLGWDASIGADYVDNATSILLNRLLVDKQTVSSAVNSTLKETGPDPDFGGILKFYPPEMGNRKIAAEGTGK
jgi:hypothetical protein